MPTSPYASYKMLFPTLKGDPLMQIAEAAFYESNDGTASMSQYRPIRFWQIHFAPDSNYPGGEAPSICHRRNA